MKRIIILDRLPSGDGGFAFKYCLWAAVSTARQPFYADPNKTSEYRDATPDEIAALRSGVVVEKVDTAGFPAGTGIAAVETYLQGLWTAYQAEVNSAQNWSKYGSCWDGNTWTLTGK